MKKMQILPMQQLPGASASGVASRSSGYREEFMLYKFGFICNKERCSNVAQLCTWPTDQGLPTLPEKGVESTAGQSLERTG